MRCLRQTAPSREHPARRITQGRQGIATGAGTITRANTESTGMDVCLPGIDRQGHAGRWMTRGRLAGGIMTPWTRAGYAVARSALGAARASRESGRKAGSWQVGRLAGWQAGSASADVTLAVDGAWKTALRRRGHKGAKGTRGRGDEGCSEKGGPCEQPASRRLTRGGLMIAQRALQVTTSAVRARRESSARRVETQPRLHGADGQMRQTFRWGAAAAQTEAANDSGRD